MVFPSGVNHCSSQYRMVLTPMNGIGLPAVPNRTLRDVFRGNSLFFRGRRVLRLGSLAWSRLIRFVHFSLVVVAGAAFGFVIGVVFIRSEARSHLVIIFGWLGVGFEIGPGIQFLQTSDLVLKLFDPSLLLTTNSCSPTICSCS